VEAISVISSQDHPRLPTIGPPLAISDERNLDNIISAIAFSSNGELFVAADGPEWPEGGGRHITVWNGESGVIMQTLRGQHRYILGIKFSPDCKLLASIGKTGVCLWTISNGKHLYGSLGSTVAFTTDSKRIAVIIIPKVRVIEVATSKTLLELDVPTILSDCIVFTPNNWLITISHRPPSVEVWELYEKTADIKVVEGFMSSSDFIGSAVAISQDGERITTIFEPSDFITPSSNHERRKPNRTEVRETKKHGSTLWLRNLTSMALMALAFSPDGKTLAIVSSWSCDLYDAASGATLYDVISRGYSLIAITFSLDGNRLVTSSFGGRGSLNYLQYADLAGKLVADEPIYRRWDDEPSSTKQDLIEIEVTCFRRRMPNGLLEDMIYAHVHSKFSDTYSDFPNLSRQSSEGCQTSKFILDVFETDIDYRNWNDVVKSFKSR
jgi:WD40 repeat protein